MTSVAYPPVPHHYKCAKCSEVRDLYQVPCPACGSSVVHAIVIDRRKR